jgi:hypothetical protein
MNKKYAPVLVGVYDRFDHFSQCIESLKNNSLAIHTDLFIASDFPANEPNEAVENIREFCRGINGFKTVTLIFREKNFGARKNYSEAKNFIFEKYDRMILMEDDVVTSKYFLKFINDGLDIYADNPNVVGVCGYLFPEGSGTVDNTFFLQRRIPYGYGFWKDKEVILDKAKVPLSRLALKDWRTFKQLTHETPHLARNLPFIVEGDFSPGDMQTSTVMRVLGLYALYPSVSLTRNIGLDGSGLNCYADSEMQSQVIGNEMVVVEKQSCISENRKYAGLLTRRWAKNGDILVNSIIFLLYNYMPGFYFLYQRFWKSYRILRKRLV